MAVVAALDLVLAIANPAEHAVGTRLLSSAVILVAAAPFARWLFRGERVGLPVFELFMLFHAVCFGFAGMMPQASSLTSRTPVSPEQWDDALLAVLVCLSCMAAGFYATVAGMPSDRAADYWPFRFAPSLFGLAVPVILVLLVGFDLFQSSVPTGVRQPMQAALLFWFLVLVAAAFLGQLAEPRRSLVLFVLVPVNALLFSSFGDATLYGLFAILIPVALTRFVVVKRLPWVLATVVVVAFIAFQPVKSELRRQTAQENLSHSGVVSAFPAIALDRFRGRQESGLTSWDWFADAFRRLNHLHVTAAIMADTPDSVPFAHGSTYAPLLTKLIPRALWPDKPLEAQGNAWAQEYGYLSSDDDVTSFNLPFLTEMYMNFGYPGLIVVGALLGALMGLWTTRVWGREGDCTFLAFSIQTAVPFLTPESNLSLLLGHAVIGAITAYLSLTLATWLAPEFRKTRASGQPSGLRAGPVRISARTKPSQYVRSSRDSLV